jgi:predicted enzyme related to lactoylglutathione lyase
MKPQGAITFFYYDDIGPAVAFYEDVMGFERVEDQGWAVIFRAGAGAYVGVVDGAKGSFQHQDHNAVLLTLVVDDVDAWHAALKAKGVPLWKEIRTVPEIEVRCFFIQDPGGYAIEIQQFLNAQAARTFTQPSRQQTS